MPIPKITGCLQIFHRLSSDDALHPLVHHRRHKAAAAQAIGDRPHVKFMRQRSAPRARAPMREAVLYSSQAVDPPFATHAGAPA